MFLTATDTKCQSRCGTAQGDQRERCLLYVKTNCLAKNME
ncbi:hypothetical protein HMPREF9518_02015 [Enterococcus faecalis TX1342]|nr:hypothetical protein HMPREF9518_02015 [Enterococcus faecalis TX1342]